MGFSDANYHFPQVENLSINSKTVSESDRPADQDILESIQAAYFSINPSFDICRFELEVSSLKKNYKYSDGIFFRNFLRFWIAIRFNVILKI